jgi:hypothetical protein
VSVAHPFLAISLVFIAAGCAPPSTLESPSPAVAADAEALACAADGGATADLPAWSLSTADDPAFVPVVQSSMLTVGPNRFLYNVLDPTFRQLASPDAASRVDFYALERDPATSVASRDATYLSSGLGRGLYRTVIDFDCAGEWGAEVSFEQNDGSMARQRLRFQVHPEGSTAAIGAPAPLSDSPTAGTLDEVRGISTDPHPYLRAYDTTVAEAVTSGRPSLVFFATPGFCQSGYCGPTVELVKGVARDHEDEVDFVTVEPYELEMTANGLQPDPDAAGHLRPVPAALEYGIPVEPYLFVVDAAGDVFARFEGIVGEDELRASLEDVLAASA